MEREITHYQIINEMRTEDVESKVQGLIAHGWQPWGSLSSMSCGSTRYYSQAMVKFKKA